MKKVLSIVLVVAMLATMVIFSVSSSATGEVEPSLKRTEYGNTEVNVPYFGGEVTFRMLTGSAGIAPDRKEEHYDDLGVFGNGDSSLGELCIDGIIDEGEWGAPIATFYSDYAANNIDAMGKHLIRQEEQNPMFESPSAENTYYFAKDSAPLAGLFFRLYLMWDEDYFYLAVETNDPDAPKQVNTGADIWNGDCVQVRIDTQGVNSFVEGGQFDASRKTTHQNLDNQTVYDYATPWAGCEYREWGEYSGLKYERVPNFMFSYTNAAGGGTEAFDASLRFDPEVQQYQGTVGGEIVDLERTIYKGRDVSANSDDEVIFEDPCLATIRWDNYGTVNERDDRAVYEIAIPWYLIQASDTEEFIPEENAVLGMSVALLDAARSNTPVGQADDEYTSYLAWGSGICGSQISNDPQTTAGNNKIVLSSTPYNQVVACEHQFAEATCLAPETCTLCGYQRGFASGHSNVFSNVVLPTAEAAGSITSTCTVCGNSYDTEITYDGNRVFEQFVEDTPSVMNHTHFGSGWTTNWYDNVAPKEGEVDTRKLLYRADGTSKTAFDNTTFGYSVIDCATNGAGLVYANGDPAVIGEDVDFGTQTGTYFDWYQNTDDFSHNNAYSYNMEVYLPSLDKAYQSGDYTHLLAFFFGGRRTTNGAPGIKYYAGLFSLDDNQTYAWAIADVGLITSISDSETFQKYAIVYEEVDAEDIKTGEWVNYNFIFDNDTGVALLYWDGELVCAAEDYHLKTLESMNFVLFRRFDFPFYAKNIKVAQMGAGFDIVNPTTSATYTLTIDGVETQVEAGETVNLNAAAFENGYRFAEWEGDVSVLTLNVNNASFTMPEADVTLTSKYVLVGDANTDGKINAQDANFLSQIIVGSVGSVIPADINNDGKVNATDSNMLTKMITGTYSPIA